MQALSGVLRRGVTTADAARWLDQELAEKTSNADTHPSLADRLAALAYLPAGGDSYALRDRLTAYFRRSRNSSSWRSRTRPGINSTPMGATPGFQRRSPPDSSCRGRE